MRKLNINTNNAALKVYCYGTHRSTAPAKTIERAQPYLRHMGITRVANVTGLDRIGIPVVMVTRPNSRSVSVSQGKGLDLDAAKASALMESSEVWHAEQITLPLVYGSYAGLADHYPLADPDALQRIPSSYFTDDTRILWIEGSNLIDTQNLWVPFEMVHTDYSQPSPPGHGCFHCSTNGLASGNQLIEAQCHAICEVIERDATTILHHLSLPDRALRRLDVRSVDSQECWKLLEQLRMANLKLAIWDTTTDVGVPSFYGLLIGSDGEYPEHIGAGAGCHPCKSIALSRTITEAVQTRLTYISGARDDLLASEFEDGGLRDKYQSAKSFISNEVPTRLYSSIPDYSSELLSDDLSWLIGKLKRVGINQIISVDLTKSDIDIPVVRIIIPGLEAPHDDDDYVPGARVIGLT
jgi:YcaO-like protein with predicted kinase domain